MRPERKVDDEERGRMTGWGVSVAIHAVILVTAALIGGLHTARHAPPPSAPTVGIHLQPPAPVVVAAAENRAVELSSPPAPAATPSRPAVEPPSIAASKIEPTAPVRSVPSPAPAPSPEAIGKTLASAAAPAAAPAPEAARPAPIVTPTAATDMIDTTGPSAASKKIEESSITGSEAAGPSDAKPMQSQAAAVPSHEPERAIPPLAIDPPRLTAVVVVEIPAVYYPLPSLRAGEEGEVLLELEILQDGRVGEIRAIRGQDHPRLLAAATSSARRARFVAATRDGVPVVASVQLPFHFVLRAGDKGA